MTVKCNQVDCIEHWTITAPAENRVRGHSFHRQSHRRQATHLHFGRQ